MQIANKEQTRRFIEQDGAVYYTYNASSNDGYNYVIDKNEHLARIDHLKDKLPSDGSMKVILNKVRAGYGKQSEEGTYFVSLGRRIFKRVGMVTGGSIVIDIKADTLSKFLQKDELEDSSLWIIDDSMKSIFNPDKEKIGTIAEEFFNKDLIKGKSGSFTTTLNGKSQFFVYNVSAVTGWTIILSVPSKNFNAPILNLGYVIGFTSLIVFPLTLCIGYIFIRSIMKPIKYLQNNMLKVGEGNWVEIKGYIPENELGTLFKTYNKMVRKISDLIETVYKSQLEKRKHEMAKQKAEFQALQSQINPHFLYNTLGTINSYAIIADQEPIQEMVEALSSMFRYWVQNPLEQVQLRDEIEHVKNYLLIQSYRQQLMPEVIWNVEGYLDHFVMRLTLQPLVENIFHHAFSDGIMEHHKVQITAKK